MQPVEEEASSVASIPEAAMKEHARKLQSVHAINDLLAKSDDAYTKTDNVPVKFEVQAYLLSNIKNAFQAVSNCLTSHLTDHLRPELGHIEPKDSVEMHHRLLFNMDMYSEAIELSGRLLLFLMHEGEVDLIDIHFAKIIRELIVLWSLVEAEGDVRLPYDIEKLLGSYVKSTGNIEQIVSVINSYGLDAEDMTIRFKMTQSIPKLVIEIYKQFGNFKESTLATASQFQLMMRKLLLLARTDKVDSIRVEAQASIRAIIRNLTKKEHELTALVECLSRQEV